MTEPTIAQPTTTEPTMTDGPAHYHPDLSIDQQLALRTAARRLTDEFDGTYGTPKPSSGSCTPATTSSRR